MRIGRLYSALREVTDPDDPRVAKVLKAFDATPETAVRWRRATNYWLARHGRAWLRERRLGLALPLEIAGLVGAEKAAATFVTVLEDDGAPDLVAAIAAQRIRLLPRLNDPLRQRAARALERRIAAWEKVPDKRSHADCACPSLVLLSGTRSVPWIADRLAEGDCATAKITALAVMELDNEGTLPALAEEDRERLFAAVSQRLTRERTCCRPDHEAIAYANLVWALMTATPTQRLDETAKLLATAFTEPRPFLQDAAAVRAGRRLQQRFGDAFLQAMAGALDDQAALARYAELLRS